MRRKRRDATADVPDHLLYFRPDRWADDVNEASDLWRAARLAWLEENQDRIDGLWFLRQGFLERRGEPWDDLERYEPSRRRRR